MLPDPEAGKAIDYPYAALMAFMEVGKTLTFSLDQTDKIVDSLRNHWPKRQWYARSRYETKFRRIWHKRAKAVLAWSKKDNYAQTRLCRQIHGA